MGEKIYPCTAGFRGRVRPSALSGGHRRLVADTGGVHSVRVSFDSRAKGDPRGIGRYVRCLLEALRETAEPGSVITETHRPRRSDVFHSPWLDGASLRSPCPTVVTLHDLINLKRRAEYLRTGVRFKLRYLAVQRADRVIVPTQVVANDAR